VSNKIFGEYLRLSSALFTRGLLLLAAGPRGDLKLKPFDGQRVRYLMPSSFSGPLCYWSPTWIKLSM